MREPVGRKLVQGREVIGRVIARECPEGLALKWSWVVRRAELAEAYRTLPGGRGPEDSDHRLVTACEVLRALG